MINAKLTQYIPLIMHINAVLSSSSSYSLYLQHTGDPQQSQSQRSQKWK